MLRTLPYTLHRYPPYRKTQPSATVFPLFLIVERELGTMLNAFLGVDTLKR
ncbi:BnaC02g28760D [Brassica napus]|uniref:BnaC02g28760D protein n=1 Tax=Brassica napus TaxID=3708 RepID=A0A078G890_BRANA|nr:BnaC02g28760D [Brassica napus]